MSHFHANYANTFGKRSTKQTETPPPVTWAAVEIHAPANMHDGSVRCVTRAPSDGRWVPVAQAPLRRQAAAGGHHLEASAACARGSSSARVGCSLVATKDPPRAVGAWCPLWHSRQIHCPLGMLTSSRACLTPLDTERSPGMRSAAQHEPNRAAAGPSAAGTSCDALRCPRVNPPAFTEPPPGLGWKGP